MIAIDIEMPKSCIHCPFLDWGWCGCNVSPEVVVDMGEEQRAKNCPLIEVATCEDCKHNAKNVCDMGHRFRMREPSTFCCIDCKRSE